MRLPPVGGGGGGAVGGRSFFKSGCEFGNRPTDGDAAVAAVVIAHLDGRGGEVTVTQSKSEVRGTLVR